MAFSPLPDLPQAVQLSEMNGTYSRSGIYFLWRGDAVVYVGQTRNVIKRVIEHMAERAKVFDGVSFAPCPPRELAKTERFFIEALLPAYNRCGLSESIRRIWVGHMDERPRPERMVGPDLAAAILGVNREQLRLLDKHGLPSKSVRRPRSKVRRRLYSVRDLHQFTAQKAGVIAEARRETPSSSLSQDIG